MSRSSPRSSNLPYMYHVNMPSCNFWQVSARAHCWQPAQIHCHPHDTTTCAWPASWTHEVEEYYYSRVPLGALMGESLGDCPKPATTVELGQCNFKLNLCRAVVLAFAWNNYGVDRCQTTLRRSALALPVCRSEADVASLARFCFVSLSARRQVR